MSKVAVGFEILVNDMARTKRFYSHVTQSTFRDKDMQSMNMLMFKGSETDTCGMLV